MEERIELAWDPETLQTLSPFGSLRNGGVAAAAGSCYVT
jgi:hypothetical protein